MTALGDHAAAELTYQGTEEPAKTNIVGIVGMFAEFSNQLRPMIIDQVLKLLDFQPLSELTNANSEWQERTDVVPGQSVWQSNRWPDAWSYDPAHGSYFLMSQHNPSSQSTSAVYPTEPAS